VVTVQRTQTATAHEESSREREATRPSPTTRENEPPSTTSERRGKGLLSWLNRS
jgi:hypothetical protein